MRAKRKQVYLDRVTLNCELPPRIMVAGHMRIDRSPQANFRPVYSELSIDDAIQLRDQLTRRIEEAAQRGADDA